MERAEKKNRERKIFDLVYATRATGTVTDSETPDFLVSPPLGRRNFGVEVTELYGSDSSARLERTPGYSLDLLAGGKFIHRDDEQGLRIGKVDIVTREGAVVYSQIRGIVQSAPTFAESARKAAERILGKSRRLGLPRSDLTHVNLIIHDRTNLLTFQAAESFSKAYFVPELRLALQAAQFREIFFLTKMKGGPGFIPLKMLLLVIEFYAFNRVYTDHQYSRRLDPNVREAEVFASYFANLVAGPVLFREEEEGTEVLYGDSGFFVTRDLGVKIRTYRDQPFPTDARPPCAHFVSCLGAEFAERLEAYRLANAFTCPLVFPTGPFDDWS